jgi:hypothetical protein
MSGYVSLTLTEPQHKQLQFELSQTEGQEEIAFILCGQSIGNERLRLLTKSIHPVQPEFVISRSPMGIKWSTDFLDPLLNTATEQGLSVIKVHTHPNGFEKFSEVDEISDSDLLPFIADWVGLNIPHGSAILLPDGRLFARWFDTTSGSLIPFDKVSVVGSDIKFYGNSSSVIDGAFQSHAQAFGQGTVDILKSMRIGIVGCSGTGSPTIEQLVRLGVGELVLIDEDVVEERNLNRIVNTTRQDAELRRPKVEALKETIEKIDIGTKVISLQCDVASSEAIQALGQCDVIFGCVDTHQARLTMNLISSYYLIPYFDLGVRLDAAQDSSIGRTIQAVCGSVHYVKPGGSSLFTRGVINPKKLADESLKKTATDAYKQQLDEGYIYGTVEHSPAVISVNMLASSLAVNDFLARIHPYRNEPNIKTDQIEFDLCEMGFYPEAHQDICSIMSPYLGRGDCTPLLGITPMQEVVQCTK